MSRRHQTQPKPNVLFMDFAASWLKKKKMSIMISYFVSQPPSLIADVFYNPAAKGRDDLKKKKKNIIF